MEDFKIYEKKSKFFVFMIALVLCAILIFEGAIIAGAVEFPYKPDNAYFWGGQHLDDVRCGNYTGSLYQEDSGAWYLVCSNGEVPASGSKEAPLPKYERIYTSGGET